MKFDYRPDIDGLRAIAVIVVILFHFDVPGFSGGFIGVDIFFVISGYLITRNLVAAGSSLSLAEFYGRRMRRILPAMLVMMGLSLLAGWFLLLPGDYASLGRSAAFSAAGLGNYYFLWNTGYSTARRRFCRCCIFGRSASKSSSTSCGRLCLGQRTG